VLPSLGAGCLYCTPSLHLTLQQRVVGSIRSCVTPYGRLDSSSCSQLSRGRSVVIALYEVPCAQGLTGGGLYRTPLLHLTLQMGHRFHTLSVLLYSWLDRSYSVNARSRYYMLTVVLV
jgi:hypothetical protein